MRIQRIFMLTGVLLAVFCFSGSCKKVEVDKKQNDPEPDPQIAFDHQGPFLPIDFELQRNTLTVLFSNHKIDEIESGIGVFKRAGEQWRLRYFIGQQDISAGLDFPHTIKLTDEGFLISDMGGDRAIEIDREGKVVRTYSAIGVNEALPIVFQGQKAVLLSSNGRSATILIMNDQGNVLWSFRLREQFPGEDDIMIHHANQLANRNILVPVSLGTKHERGRILEIDQDKQIVWQFQHDDLEWPRNALRLPNGNTLVSHRSGIWEVTRQGKIVWEYKSDKPVYNLARLADGTTMAIFDNSLIWIPKDCESIECVEKWFLYHPPQTAIGFDFEPILPPSVLKKLKNHPYLN